ncbi:hypothetical protein ABEB36_002204 [Hypothenemus hampei]|uniref:Dystrophin n=1 Tax=Hypothenemus hampei TaxID=57062 RepID=A0ABD1F7H5_HYPHA
MSNWKKGENEKGFPYYINKETNTKQWDHPKFSDVKQAIDDCNYIVYSTYRLAMKIRAIQRHLHMEDITLDTITAMFDRHRLANNENSLILETYDLEAVLSDIFFSANKVNHTNIDIDFATEIFINFLFNVFDSCRKGQIQILSTKIALGLLCNCSLPALHKYFFSLSADHNNCITRVRLQGLFKKIHLIIEYLHEGATFDMKLLNSAVESCFRNSPGFVGVPEQTFTTWLNSEVPFLCWIPYVLKLRLSETAIKTIKCITCHTKPLLGLWYRCTKCPKYTQCQRCFFTGRMNMSHKLTHVLKEYSPVPSKQNSLSDKTYLNKFCNLFNMGRKKEIYTTVKPCRQFTNETMKKCSSVEPFCNIEPLSTPEMQLQGVIRHLESQNRELQQILTFGNHNEKEIRTYLEEYRVFMAGNIQKLKILKNQININSSQENIRINEGSNTKEKAHSTPMAYSNTEQKNFNKFRNMSPVTVMTDLEDSSLPDKTTNGLEAVISNASKPKKNLNIPQTPVKILHNDLDAALVQLQQILANNFSLEDSLYNLDNTNLKTAVTEVEGMLTSIIDNVESSRCNSALNK